MDADGIKEPANLSMEKARTVQPDWTTFNGYANQYVTHPLTAKPGETTRFYSGRSRPDPRYQFPRRRHHLRPCVGQRRHEEPTPARMQTVLVPAGGAGIFDVKVDQPGLYPFVSHAFAHVDHLGHMVGLLKVGNPKGTMSHYGLAPWASCSKNSRPIQ